MTKRGKKTKLNLKKRTLRSLDRGELGNVQGGVPVGVSGVAGSGGTLLEPPPPPPPPPGGSIIGFTENNCTATQTCRCLTRAVGASGRGG